MGDVMESDQFFKKLNAIITNKDYHWIFAAVKGFRNGIIYGARIRFSHALVITFLFGKGLTREKLIIIAKLTRTHAWNLAKFVFTYKLGYGGLKALFDDDKAGWQILLAGSVAAYIHIREMNAVNTQLLFYLFSRVVIGLCRLISKKGYTPPGLTQRKLFPYLNAFLWSACLWLCCYHPDVLQPSMVASYEYLYSDSDHFHSLADLILYNRKPKCK